MRRLRALPTWQLTLGIALLALGFLVAAQAQSQAPRIRYTTQERPPLVETALDLTTEQQRLKARILGLNTEILALEQSSAGGDELIARLNDELAQTRLAAGLVDLVGPGVALPFQDASGPIPPDAAPADYRVAASDLRDLVTDLWLSGAEAVAINNERVTAATAITDIGSSILVNSSYLAPPYVVSAIGPPDLRDRLVRLPDFVRFLEQRVHRFGLRLGLTDQLKSVVIPAYSGAIRLTELRPAASPAP